MKFEIIPNEQTPAVPVIAFSDSKLYIAKYREVLDAFLEFAETCTTAVGLAANQCSLECERLNKDKGVMEVSVERFTLPVFALRDVLTHGWSLIIDPFIQEYVGIEEEKLEGCLTWKGQNILAKRHRGVEVCYFDMDGKFHERERYKGFVGQIWQHEINHLNGVAEVVVGNDCLIPKPVTAGRNDDCPCGSGVKYKKCCLLLI